MAEEPEARPEPSQAPQMLESVTVFVGKTAVVIPGRNARVDQFPDNGPLYVDAIQPDGGIERYVGAPFMMKLASPNMVQPAPAGLIIKSS